MRVSRDLTMILLALVCLTGAANAADEPRRHRNDEFGIEARFPAGARVCVALSGDHPVGFHAWLGRPTDCNAPRPPLVSAMNVTAIYNATAETAPDAFLDCRNGSVPRRSGVDLRGLGFRHAASVRCAVRRRDGSLEILVAAQGGRYARRDGSPLSRAPLINYAAVLKTRPERLRRDLATFRNFLATIVIRPIVLR
jgi:hypothetical protein